MADRRVVAYFGDRGALESMVRTSAARGERVVAVALDLGGPAPLSGLRDDALALGALRCHVLDLREEFARDVIAAVQADLVDPRGSVERHARRFLANALESIARLEAAAVEQPRGLVLPWATPLAPRPGQLAATLALRFEEGMPVELNGIPMSAAELLESLETITRQAAVDVLQLAFTDLLASPDGIVEMKTDGRRVDLLSRLVIS